MRLTVEVLESLHRLKKTDNISNNFVSKWLEKAKSDEKMACLRESALVFLSGDFFSSLV